MVKMNGFSIKARVFFLGLPWFLAALVLISCTDFFSSSWGTWAARDPSELVPPVTPGNVKELVSMAENDPDLSLEVLKGIKKAVGKAGGQDKAKLQNSAITAAVNASNMGNALLNNAADLAGMEDAEMVKDLLIDTINGLGNLTSAADNLTVILPDPSDTAAFGAFVDSASADDLALAAALIMAGDAKKSGDPDAYMSGYTPGSPATPTAALAEELAAEASLKYSDPGYTGGGILGDLLGSLGLI
jgi:hypothetical protein